MLSLAILLLVTASGPKQPEKAALPLDCRLANSHVEAAIARRAAALDADEYCQFRRYESLSDLDSDGQNDLIVLFTVEPRGGNDHRGFMAVFLSSRPAGAEPFLVPTGGRGERDAIGITVRGRSITLETREYLPSDPLCCPSGKGTLVFEFTGTSLRQVPRRPKKTGTGG